MKERGVGRTCSTGIHCAQVARVFAAIFAAWGWVPGPPESAFCLVLGTFSQESRALGHKFMGLVILSSLIKIEWARVMAKLWLPGSRKESLGNL